MVHLPVRNEDCSYGKELALIPETAKVSIGYLPLTMENIAMVLFQSLGDAYGWGGMLNEDDCTGMMGTIYSCFGLDVARNGNWQWNMNIEKMDITNLTLEEKCALLDQLPFGAALSFPGHQMMSLGKVDGKYYVLSTVSSIISPETGKTLRTRDVMINTLDVKRANGKTWLGALNRVFLFYYPTDTERQFNLPTSEWYHDGVAFCLKNKMMQSDENKFFNPATDDSWATALDILFDMEETKPEYEFEEDAAWYAWAVKWAKDSELIHENDKDFDPESAISREQLASVLYLYAQFKGYDVSVGEETNILSYDDAFDISEYAIPAMQYVIGAGIINGKTIGTVNPKDNATRAEIAVILHRFIEKTKEI